MTTPPSTPLITHIIIDVNALIAENNKLRIENETLKNKQEIVALLDKYSRKYTFYLEEVPSTDYLEIMLHIYYIHKINVNCTLEINWTDGRGNRLPAQGTRCHSMESKAVLTVWYVTTGSKHHIPFFCHTDYTILQFPKKCKISYFNLVYDK